MVAIDAQPLAVQIVAANVRSTHCPRWLQGIATINRLRSSGTTPLQPDQAAVPAALDRLCVHGQGKVAERIAAARLLPSICRQGDPEVLAVLLGDSISSSGCGLLDRASEVRAACATTIGTISRETGNARVIGHLIELFKDSDWTALTSVASQGDQHCIEKLIECLEGSTWSSRVLSAQALGKIAPRGNPAAVAALANALSDEDWAVQKAAAFSMGMVAAVGDGDALEALLPLLNDADWRVRKTVLVAIGSISERGCRRAIEAILPRLDDTCLAAPQRLDQGTNGVMDVKMTAVKVICQLSEPRDGEVLRALREFQSKLKLPQEERLHLAMTEACDAISDVSDHEVERVGGMAERSDEIVWASEGGEVFVAETAAAVGAGVGGAAPFVEGLGGQGTRADGWGCGYIVDVVRLEVLLDGASDTASESDDSGCVYNYESHGEDW